MANLQSTTVTGTLTVDGTEIGGGKSLKYQEFTTSGTFTPTAAGISAGGVHQVFIVGGGERGNSSTQGGAGGEVVEKFVTLANTTACAVTIGAGGGSNGADGGFSLFAGSSAGGSDIRAEGGRGLNAVSGSMSSGAGGYYVSSTPGATISTVTVSVTINPASINTVYGRSHGYQSAYGYGYQYAYQSAYSAAAGAGPGYKGYGAGGAASATGIATPGANSGAGSPSGTNAANGYCLITWFED